MSLFDRPNQPVLPAASSVNQTALNAQAAQAGPLPAQLVLTSSTETVVPHPTNAAIPLSVQLPPDTMNEQSLLVLEASGYIKTTNATNITVKVYSGTSLTVGSDVQLGTSGAIAQNSATAPFVALLYLVYDSVSGKLHGWFKFLVNNNLVAEGALSNVVTGINNTTIAGVANFLLSFTSSAAAGGNPTTINVQRFSVG